VRNRKEQEIEKEPQKPKTPAQTPNPAQTLNPAIQPNLTPLFSRPTRDRARSTPACFAQQPIASRLASSFARPAPRPASASRPAPHGPPRGLPPPRAQLRTARPAPHPLTSRPHW